MLHAAPLPDGDVDKLIARDVEIARLTAQLEDKRQALQAKQDVINSVATYMRNDDPARSQDIDPEWADLIRKVRAKV